MPPSNMVIPICLSAAAVLSVLGHLWTRYRPGTRLKLLYVVSAAAGFGSLIMLLLAPESIYGSLSRSSACIGIGLVWYTAYLTFKSRTVPHTLIGLMVLFSVGSWLSDINPNLPTLSSFWFRLAQVVFAQSLCLWLSAAAQAAEHAEDPHIPTYAFILVVAANIILAVGALATWGQPFNWDPLEGWWLFASLTAGIAIIGSRRGWPSWVVNGIGLIPSALTWFASWGIIQTLHLTSIYLVQA
ncbi:MAG: hypothetical protein LLG44_10490 [Chloroflexi bacterium]|nr:hypothetical protein [Chloroflexota bacterium]